MHSSLSLKFRSIIQKTKTKNILRLIATDVVRAGHWSVVGGERRVFATLDG